jgi:hypothetical protein
MASRAIEHSIGHKQLARTGGASSSNTKSAMVQAALGLAIFIPLLAVAYLAVGLVREGLGQ